MDIDQSGLRGAHEKKAKSFEGIYDEAGEADKLPWAHSEPTPFLPEVTQAREKPGRALDIGCGSGVDSVYLAELGWDVTSLDFMADAQKWTGDRAKKAGVNLHLVQQDVTTWDNTDTFDLILDAGVLHNMKPVQKPEYRKRILKWLAPDGVYILCHFEKRHMFEWRPIGPRRISRTNIQKMFAPELIEKNYHQKISTGLPIIIGPSLALSTYWFRRA